MDSSSTVSKLILEQSGKRIGELFGSKVIAVRVMYHDPKILKSPRDIEPYLLKVFNSYPVHLSSLVDWSEGFGDPSILAKLVFEDGKVGELEVTEGVTQNLCFRDRKGDLFWVRGLKKR